MEEYLGQLAEAAAANNSWSSRFELTVEGRTAEDRPIYLLRIGSNDGPAIFIDAGKIMVTPL